MSALSLAIPCRFLRGSYAKLGLTVVALACGVALVCAMDLVNRAVLRAFVEVVDTMAGRAALQVNAGEESIFPEEVARTVAGLPGVEIAVPVVTATAFVADDTAELLTIHGVDVGNEAAIRVYEARDRNDLEIDDPLVFLSQPDSIILTRTFAGRRGLGVGDRITLVTPTGNRTFTVRGLLEPEGVGRVYGGNLVVMDLFAAEQVFTRSGFINRLDVVVERGHDVVEVQRAIAAALPAGVQVEAPAQRKTDIHKVMRSLQMMLEGMALVALVAAFLIAFNRLSTIFEMRIWQLGVLRAVGARRRVVWRELVKESLLLGGAGVLLGVPAGIALGHLILPVIATTTALNYKLIAPEATLAINSASIAVAAALGIGAALLAAAVPAWRVSGAALADAIGRRGAEMPAGGRPWLWGLRIAVLASIAGAVWTQAATREPQWGLAATGLIAVGAALAGQPLLQIAHRPLARFLDSLPGGVGRFASKALTRDSRRAALTIGMVGVGVASVIWLWTVAQSFERTLIDTLGRAFRADLIVSSSHVASGPDDVPFDGGLVGEMHGLSGVQDVLGERLADWHYAGGSICLSAFDPEYFQDPAFGRWSLVGPSIPHVWEAVARGEAVVVSTNFIQNLRVNVGQPIILDTPSGPLQLVVGGATTAFASARGTLEMSRALYRQYWHDDQVTRIHIRVIPGTNLTTLRSDIARTFAGRFRLRILSAHELLDFWTVQVRRAFAPIDVVGALALLVILVGMADTLAAGVVERTRELGTMRAVGARRNRVGRIVLVEGLVLGLLGLLVAVVTGLAMGTLWVNATFPLLMGWALQLHVPYTAVILVGLVTIGVCFCASLMPARQAARLEPAVALRYD